MRSSAIFMLVVVCGCASVPDAPVPVVLSGGPEISADWARVDSSIDPMISAPTAEPPLPLLPLRIEISPNRPRQASVVSIRIKEPPGPALEEPAVRFAGRDVTLLRQGTGWVGLAGLPVDSAGLFEVDVTGRRGTLQESVRRVIRVVPRDYPATRISISAGDRSDPEVDARVAREQDLIRTRLASSSREWMPEGPFDWPRPPVRTSPFGQRRVFNGQVRSRHMGLDLRGRRGQGTYAPAAGRVLLTGRFFYQGNAVYLDHGLGLVTAYFHFSSIEVEEGELVQPGQLLGRVGSTGRSTAPHLHWSAYVHGASVDPESLVGFQLSPVEGMTGDAGALTQKR